MRSLPILDDVSRLIPYLWALCKCRVKLLQNNVNHNFQEERLHPEAALLSQLRLPQEQLPVLDLRLPIHGGPLDISMQDQTFWNRVRDLRRSDHLGRGPGFRRRKRPPGLGRLLRLRQEELGQEGYRGPDYLRLCRNSALRAPKKRQQVLELSENLNMSSGTKHSSESCFGSLSSQLTNPLSCHSPIMSSN